MIGLWFCLLTFCVLVANMFCIVLKSYIWPLKISIGFEIVFLVGELGFSSSKKSRLLFWLVDWTVVFTFIVENIFCIVLNS